MKILILCNKPPYPPKEGGPIAMNAVIEGLLSEGVKVKVLSINSNKYNTKLGDIPEKYREKTDIELVDVDLSVTVGGALKNVILNKSYSIERFRSNGFDTKLIEILNREKFDIVQMELVHLSPYIDTVRKHSNAKLVLRAHNIEHLIWDRISKNETNYFKRAYLNHVKSTLKTYELSVLNKYDMILPITDKDSAFFKQHSNTKVEVIPFGIVNKSDSLNSTLKINNEKSRKTLFHLGSMDYHPNIEGLDWFLNNVWQEVRQKVSNAHLVLAGRNMPERLWKLNGIDGIEIMGEVDDSKKFMSENGVMIVPLLSGSGIRIKIVEGMSLGKTIISTSIGAEGLACQNNENILIADTAKKFVKACISCFEDENMLSKIGISAMKLIEEKHNNSKISQRLVELYKDIL